MVILATIELKMWNFFVPIAILKQKLLLVGINQRFSSNHYFRAAETNPRYSEILSIPPGTEALYSQPWVAALAGFLLQFITLLLPALHL